jgi:hypothetical protein
MYEYGAILKDREQNATVLVTRIDSRRADEFIIKEKDPSENRFSDQSVYDFNSRYPYVKPADPVVLGVYTDSLPFDADAYDQYDRGVIARNLVEKGEIKEYSFPISRLITENATDDADK